MNDCPTCGGGGLVRLMTSHLGPDDYEYDEQCPDCAGSGSADPKTAVESLPYSLHRVRGCQVIDRAAVLRILEAHLARLKTPNVGGEARLAAHQPSHTTTATPQGVASTDQLGGRVRSEKD